MATNRKRAVPTACTLRIARGNSLLAKVGANARRTNMLQRLVVCAALFIAVYVGGTSSQAERLQAEPPKDVTPKNDQKIKNLKKCREELAAKHKAILDVLKELETSEPAKQGAIEKTFLIAISDYKKELSRFELEFRPAPIAVDELLRKFIEGDLKLLKRNQVALEQLKAELAWTEKIIDSILAEIESPVSVKEHREKLAATVKTILDRCKDIATSQPELAGHLEMKFRIAIGEYENELARLELDVRLARKTVEDELQEFTKEFDHLLNYRNAQGELWRGKLVAPEKLEAAVVKAEKITDRFLAEINALGPHADLPKTAPYVHTVILTLKSDADRTAGQSVLDDLPSLRKISTVRGLWYGKPADKATPEFANKDFAVAITLLFDDYDGLKKYLDDPMHKKFADKHLKFFEKPIVYDVVTPAAAP